jgi:hypothetical protein
MAGHDLNFGGSQSSLFGFPRFRLQLELGGKPRSETDDLVAGRKPFRVFLGDDDAYC